jgi:predicted TIM-barrel fold metal-dependent hydrolase
MSESTKPFVIALEEHYSDPVVTAAQSGPPPSGNARRSPLSSVLARLPDLDEVRLKEMDEAGIDVQVLSHTPSPVQQLNPESAVELAIGANDRLAEAVARHPERFAGFAALPTPDPQARPRTSWSAASPVWASRAR